MPNWVKNIVTLAGDQIEIEKLLETTKTVEQDGNLNPFDFNKIVPMPESLNITSGSNVDLGIDILTYLETGKCSDDLSNSSKRFKDSSDNTVDEFIKYLVDNNGVDLEESKTAMSNLQNYGHKDWYSWRVDNWGTKWNSSETYIDKNVIYFETAWSMPYSIFEALSLKFPNIKIIVKYADENIGYNSGEIELQNGKLISHIEYDGVSACKVWGYDPADYFPEIYRDRRIDDILD